MRRMALLMIFVLVALLRLTGPGRVAAGGCGPTAEQLAAEPAPPTLTRAEFAVLVVRSLDREPEARAIKAESGGFPDMAGHWGEGYVELLRREGIVLGHPGGKFEPDRNITREQVKLILDRTLRAAPALSSARTGCVS